MKLLSAVVDGAYLFWAVVANALIIALLAANRPRPSLRRLERRIDALLERAGVPVTSGLPPEVEVLAKDPNGKIEAIKVLRERTGLSLAEAKKAVEESGSPSVASLERKLNKLLQRSGIKLPSGLSPEVERMAVDPARKIAAIKLHRQQTGESLSDAKEAIEEYAASQRAGA